APSGRRFVAILSCTTLSARPRPRKSARGIAAGAIGSSINSFNRLKKVDYFACLVRRAGEVLSTRTKVLSCSTLPHLALSLDCNYAVVLDGEREPSMLESERLLAKQLTAPARQRRYVGFVISRDAVEIVHGGDDLAATPCRSAV